MSTEDLLCMESFQYNDFDTVSSHPLNTFGTPIRCILDLPTRYMS